MRRGSSEERRGGLITHRKRSGPNPKPSAMHEPTLSPIAVRFHHLAHDLTLTLTLPLTLIGPRPNRFPTHRPLCPM